ncbi:MAG TPA: hypothetical protein DGQ94_12455 [Pseudomonas sp.]|nr:hypothetical protein [Pseudomonas sp.]
MGAALAAKQATRRMAPAVPVFAGKPAPTGMARASPVFAGMPAPTGTAPAFRDQARQEITTCCST